MSRERERERERENNTWKKEKSLLTLHLICVHSTENRRQETWNNVFVEFTKHKHCRKLTVLYIIGYCCISSCVRFRVLCAFRNFEY